MNAQPLLPGRGKTARDRTVGDYSLYLPGLSFLVNVDQDQYMSSVGDVVGLIVMIHDQNTVPFPEDEGIIAHPGELLWIGVRRVSNDLETKLFLFAIMPWQILHLFCILHITHIIAYVNTSAVVYS